MTFSIAIPVRNGSDYLAQAIRSALCQTRAADEIIILDDNSQDASATIAKSNEWGGRVKYHCNPTPTGFADAWNRAAAKASCDFVAILHQDDLLDCGYLSNVERGLRAFPGARHAFTACRYIDSAGNLLRNAAEPHNPTGMLLSGRQYARAYLHGVFHNRHLHQCPGVTTSRSLLLHECAYRKEAGHIADDDFFYRVGRFTPVVAITQPMASYREHMTSVTAGVRLLSLTLATDYLFQIRQRGSRSDIFDGSDEVYFERLAVRMLNEALYRGTLEVCSGAAQQVLALARELQALCPGALRRYAPQWAAPMWWALLCGRFSLLSIYVRFLAEIQLVKSKVIVHA